MNEILVDDVEFGNETKSGWTKPKSAVLDNLNLEWLKVKLIDIAHWISGIIIRISACVVFRIYNILFLNYETKIYVFTDNDFISFLLGPISKTQFSGYIFENIQLVLKYACKYKCSKTPI